MPDEKISQLDPVTDVLDTDDYVLARAGASNRITGASLKAAFGGGSGAITDYLGIERDATQTLTTTGGANATLIEFDTVFDSGGTAIAWDVGTPADIVLAKGWYSVCATLFFNEQATDAATLVWSTTVTQGGGLPMVQELGPQSLATYQPGGFQTGYVSMPSFLCPADGGILRIAGGAFRGATVDSVLNFAEIVVVKIGDAA